MSVRAEQQGLRETVPLETILLDPARYFASPNDVIADERYSPAARRQILQRWHEDALRLEDSAEEGMTGGEKSRLREIELALGRFDD